MREDRKWWGKVREIGFATEEGVGGTRESDGGGQWRGRNCSWGSWRGAGGERGEEAGRVGLDGKLGKLDGRRRGGRGTGGRSGTWRGCAEMGMEVEVLAGEGGDLAGGEAGEAGDGGGGGDDGGAAVRRRRQRRRPEAAAA